MFIRKTNFKLETHPLINSGEQKYIGLLSSIIVIIYLIKDSSVGIIITHIGNKKWIDINENKSLKLITKVNTKKKEKNIILMPHIYSIRTK